MEPKLYMFPILFKKLGKGWNQVANSIIRDSRKALRQGRIVVQFFYRRQVAQGSSCLWSTEPTHRCDLDYVTSTASHFQHSQLKGSVWKHPHIQIVRGLRFDVADKIMLN